MRSWLFLFSLGTAVNAYNTPDCESWPSEETWSQLGSQLSVLHGPFADDAYNVCETLGTNAFAISRANDGLCMHAHACQYEFCRVGFETDLPAYVVEAKSQEDIQVALAFACQ